ncbi:hypothetical protein [Streptomyces sp. ADI93-02]|uniref:hypothetical protein n=1 Tax=Streptomyces sp. ADI93-02 TaxID=1522757 RepID=UPI000F552E67|nr:hypothetical protein [Streptomyces sp. ADI93-02]RPK50547.1 hypothetical protein EES40_05765 [Streptomyces sp. ADI93-02]
MSDYNEWHKALRAFRGPASLRPCEWCGLTADEWALDPRTEHPIQRDEPDGHPYSEFSAAYKALCRPCHRRTDKLRHQVSEADFPAALDALRASRWAMVSDGHRRIDAEFRASVAEPIHRELDHQSDKRARRNRR